MLIVNDDHLMRAGVADLDQPCSYCSQAFAEYPLIMSDDRAQTVYHITCALELATDLLVDLFTFFRPPPPYARLFTLTALEPALRPEGGAKRALFHQSCVKEPGIATNDTFYGSYPWRDLFRTIQRS